MKRTPLERRTPLTSDPERVREFVARGRRSTARTMSNPAPVSPASDEQRRKVSDRVCVNCGGGPCDPAHMTSRAQGGCDHPDCVLPLCRHCHREFDEGLVDLEPVLALGQFSPERSHMAGHMSLERCIQRLRGRAA